MRFLFHFSIFTSSIFNFTHNIILICLCMNHVIWFFTKSNRHIGIGGSQHDCAPATPPSMRVRTRRFVRLRFIPDVVLQAYQSIESSTRS